MIELVEQNVISLWCFIAVFIAIVTFIVVAAAYKKPIIGEALVRYGAGKTKVSFGRGMFVIPLLHHSERVNLNTRKIAVEEKKNTNALFVKIN